jgi:hypothetical protein
LLGKSAQLAIIGIDRGHSEPSTACTSSVSCGRRRPVSAALALKHLTLDELELITI